MKVVAEDGLLVSLPYDLTLGFARFIARNPVCYLKRWCFNRVYRKNILGGHPKAIVEADFDITHVIGRNYIYDAEVINVVLDILGTFYFNLV